MHRIATALLVIGTLAPCKVLAQFNALEIPAIYAATGPFIEYISPTGGGPGETVTISGRNFVDVKQVLFGDTPAVFSVVSETSIRATVPQMSWSAPGVVILGVWAVTTRGKAQARQAFGYVSNTTVPAVIGKDLQTAQQIIVQARLAVGRITGPNMPTAIVTDQEPRERARVPNNTNVDLVTTSQASGVRTIVLFNNISDSHSLYVWLFDRATQTWTIQNGGQLLNAQSFSSPIGLQTSRFYDLTATDPQWCGTNDPRDFSCVRWYTLVPIPGDTNGPSVAITIQ